MKISDSNQARIVGISLLLLIIFCYWSIYQAEFINFDDFLYVTNNDYVKDGFSIKSIYWAFTSFDLANWHPVTMMSHMLDYQLFGMNAAGHHLMSVLFHAGNTLLIFLAFRIMTGSLWRSAILAFLFALHPLHVESVAWISERKDVLSTFFMLLSLLAYIAYTKNKAVATYLIAFFLFFMALMSKPMIVTFPFLLLLMDYWPLGRFNGDHLKHCRAPENRERLWRLVLEKIPFFIMSLIISIVTYIAQSHAGAVSSLKAMPLTFRVENAANSVVLYLVQMLFPVKLAVFYPMVGNIPLWQTICSAFFIILVTYLAWRFRLRHPFFPVGWLWYLGTLIPVIGLVQVGMQSMADRYTYIPLIGIFIILIWLFPDMTRKGKTAALLGGLALCFLAILLVATTRKQVDTWKNTMSVFSRADAATEGNILAKLQTAGHNAQMGNKDEAKAQFREILNLQPTNITALHNYGIFLINYDDYDEGVKYLREALRLQPTSITVHNSLAQALWQKGNAEEAEKLLTSSVALKPENPDTHTYLAIVISSNKERYPEAIKHYREAIRIKPNHHRAILGLSITLRRNGQIQEADRYFQQVLKENPYVIAENCFMVGANFAEQNKIEEAIEQFQEGLKILPKNEGARLLLASLYQRKGDKDKAMAQYGDIIKINPKSAAAYIGKGVVTAELGRTEEAVNYFMEAIRIDPENSTALNNVGLVAFRQDRLEEAMNYFRKALKSSPRNVEVLYNMGLTLEKMGKTGEAILQLERAIKIKPDDVKAKAFLTRLNKKYRE